MNHRTLAVVVMFTVIFLMDFGLETDIDFWWHLRTGQLIADSGEVPMRDPFSFTAVNRPWVAHEWLWELGAYYLYELGGYRLLVFLSALVATATYAVLYRVVRRIGASELFSVLLVLWAVMLAVPNFGVRPREFTYLFFVIFLERLLYRGINSGQSCWVLPPLMLLWVNLHGAFIVGIVLVAIVMLGRLVEWFRGRTDFPHRMALVAAATVTAACINPHGPAMLVYPFGYFFDTANPSFDLVTEFSSPNFHDPLYLLLAGGFVCLMLLPPQRNITSVDSLLIVSFALQALLSVRQVSLCAIVLAPQLAARVCDRWAFARERRLTGLRPFVGRLNVAILALLLVAGGVWLTRPHISEQLQLRKEPRTGAVPVAGARFIEENNLPGPIFNDQRWGGYLIQRWYPERPVFIDGRIDMYGPVVSGEYIDVVTVTPRWSMVLEKYKIRTALVAKDSPIATLFRADSSWEAAFRGELEEVFTRKTAD